jgi:ubiquinone/menaquinone biosynthesis C-methylase UbiE
MTTADQPASNPAQMYEDVLVRHIFRPLSKEVLEIAPPQSGDRVLDVACGTGIILREASHQIPELGRLAGIDLNPGMIEVGQQLVESSEHNIEWHVTSVESLPFENQEFTLAYCQQGLQFFPDRRAALTEMHRVLQDGGRMVTVTWRDLALHPFISALNDVSIEHAGTPMLAEPFSLGNTAEIETIFADAGFSSITTRHVSFTMRTDAPEQHMRMLLMGATAAIPSLQQLTPEERVNLVSRVISHAGPVFEEHSHEGELAMEWHATVAIGTR